MLSTPPAFILSQDQTLVKSVCPVQNNSGHFRTLDCFAIRFTVFLEIFISEDVRWKFIRNFQGWFMIQFSMFFFLVSNLRLMTCAPSGASFSCCYQQLLYLITDSSICQQLFLFIFVVKLSPSNNSYMIPCIFSVVNNFFYHSVPMTIYTTRWLSFSLWLTLALSDSLYIIIHNFAFVNNFFYSIFENYKL